MPPTASRAYARPVDRHAQLARARDKRSEIDDAVTCCLPPDLLPLWARIRAQFSGTPAQRLDAFLHYAGEHGGEIEQAIDDESEATLAREIRAFEGRAMASYDAMADHTPVVTFDDAVYEDSGVFLADDGLADAFDFGANAADDEPLPSPIPAPSQAPRHAPPVMNESEPIDLDRAPRIVRRRVVYLDTWPRVRSWAFEPVSWGTIPTARAPSHGRSAPRLARGPPIVTIHYMPRAATIRAVPDERTINNRASSEHASVFEIRPGGDRKSVV